MRSALEGLAVLLHPRLRKDIAERVGRTRPAVRPGSVWIHAASLGETQAAIALGEALQAPVFITSDTPEGRDLAMHWALAAPGRYAGLRPIDHHLVFGGLWSLARPRALVWMESAWWPGLSEQARNSGVPVFRVSGSVGPGTVRRWRILGPRPKLDGLYCRDDRSAKAFERAGEGPVLGVGDLKGHAPISGARLHWSCPFVIAACTHPSEEAFALEAFEKTPPGLGLVLAPRHTRRCDEVADILSNREMPWIRWSELKDGRVPEDRRVVLIDENGMLSGIYHGAQAAWIGGTRTGDVGAHSPLEAQRAGIGVLSGPFQHPHEAAFIEANAVKAATPDALARGWLAPPKPGALKPSIAPRVARHIERASTQDHVTPRRPLLAQVTAAWSRSQRTRHGRQWTTEVPTLAVGGASARGSGKTTLGRHLATFLARCGYRVGVVARGYGRAGGREVRGSWDTLDGRLLGDDAALYALDGHLVASGPDRVASAKALLDQGVNLLVLEDGLQQRDVVADWRAAIVDTSDPMAGGAYPAGDLRQDRLVPEACDRVVGLNGAWEGAIEARLLPGPWHRGSSQQTPKAQLAGFCGVGRAWRVQDLLHPHLAKFKAFPDHRAYPERTLGKLHKWANGAELACSRKDHVRLPPSLAQHVWWRDIYLELDATLVLPVAWCTKERACSLKNS